MENEFNLSDKINRQTWLDENGKAQDVYVIKVEDVKEFIKRLKEVLKESLDPGINQEVWFRCVFDKLAGDKLI